MVGSFLVAFMGAGSNPGSTLATVSSFLPPVAPLVMPVRIAAGEVAAWQVAASLGTMLVSILAVVLLASRLYEGRSCAPAPGSSCATPGRAPAAGPPPPGPEGPGRLAPMPGS